MTTLKLKNGKEITNSFGINLVQTYDQAFKIATEDFGWEKNEICERQKNVNLETNNPKDYRYKTIEKVNINYIMVDPGAEIQIAFLEF